MDFRTSSFGNSLSMVRNPHHKRLDKLERFIPLRWTFRFCPNVSEFCGGGVCSLCQHSQRRVWFAQERNGWNSSPTKTEVVKCIGFLVTGDKQVWEYAYLVLSLPGYSQKTRHCCSLTTSFTTRAYVDYAEAQKIFFPPIASKLITKGLVSNL